MEKLNVIKFLLAEIESEKKLFEIYEEDLKQAKEKGSKKFESVWEHTKYRGRMPSKSRIKDDCKKVRQLLLEISKETI